MHRPLFAPHGSKQPITMNVIIKDMSHYHDKPFTFETLMTHLSEETETQSLPKINEIYLTTGLLDGGTTHTYVGPYQGVAFCTGAGNRHVKSKSENTDKLIFDGPPKTEINK